MSDTRTLIAQHRTRYDDGRFRCACSARPWILYSTFADHLAEVILAEFLVIPRAGIETEYGYRRPESNAWPVTGGREQSIRLAALNLAEPVSRPVLPWSPIPLPKDGTE